MSATIWKYQLLQTDYQVVFMPDGAAPLHVGLQDDHWMVWAMVDPNAHPEPRYIAVVGTGHPIPDGTGSYLGTIQQPPFVWHLFEMREMVVERES